MTTTSSLCWCRYIPSKKHTAERVISAIKRLENQISASVGAIQTDRGRKFVNGVIDDYLDARGIMHDLSAPYSPQH
ncbi:hypothetical protein GPECTOR_223g487 [Gonium pectorale]|uniref:Integrase catalytic domain-containing protein n=1 Tax=Gonium pectorale TaxID=33097 RepID=A0A150FWN5_GONPE|nr:hypothetical protein GPECTOR_223g487 [Gonium pectorale]|eukprot:KXZ42009.1 hypothetical protein GPECTOR_223g487 [Gonium pectorale]